MKVESHQLSGSIEPEWQQQFTWDASKDSLILQRDQVAFEEAVTVFGDPLARIHDDPAHSERERREIVVGYSTRGHLLLVSFTEREGVVRLISARRATRHERDDYENFEKS